MLPIHPMSHHTPDYSGSSRIFWIATVQPKVPVDVAATGPRVIAAAARHADRVSLNVGADMERIRWGMDVARAARAEAGLSPEIPFSGLPDNDVPAGK